MDPIIIGLAAASVATSVFGGMSAKSAAKKAARQQATLTFAQRQEEMRRQKLENEQVLGTARAAVGASNILNKGSTRRYITGIDMKQMRELAYQEKAAQMGEAGY